MHLKYRPKTLEQIVGNDEIKKVIPTLRLDRPILLEGMMGSGKTSIARILASMFGADEYNITEIDCEYFSKVDNMRLELDKLTKSSLFGKKKVLILDEIHGLSDKSLKVLLTPLEKESLLKDVLIIGCTTEIKSMSEILLSRFTILRVRPLSVAESKQLLNYVCEQEGISLDKAFKQLLIEKSEGIPRILLKNINVVRGVDSIEEAKYLLELSSMGGSDPDALTLYKFLMSDLSWAKVKGVLSSILLKKSPSTIRIGLLNLISGRLVSDYFKEAEGQKLILLYENLERANQIPEKSSLIVCLYTYITNR
uniref:Putative DNA polymerase n=1 Tax=viral metagenome TaxID=1070528 RepID=A0A6M3JLE7_9ZZZZ